MHLPSAVVLDRGEGVHEARQRPGPLRITQNQQLRLRVRQFAPDPLPPGVSDRVVKLPETIFCSELAAYSKQTA